MEVNVVHSGSSGNLCVIDGVIAIDAGWQYDRISALKGLFLTHIHTDHTKYLQDFACVPIYATEETASKLMEKRFPYIAFNTLGVGRAIRIENGDDVYLVCPWLMKHDAPCIGFEIHKHPPYSGTEVIFYATDFNEIVDEERFVKLLRDKHFDELYIECNNTLLPTDFLDVYFGDEVPRDEFHRRKSYENHCNVGYLYSLFERAGYTSKRRFTEPVTLLHKSSFYYMQNPERLVELQKIANIQNLMFETDNLKTK